jgi:hypothetical protein
MRYNSDAVQNAMKLSEPGVYGARLLFIDHSGHLRLPCLIPTPHDPRPGRFVCHLDFNHFCTIGMCRLVDEGINSHFVTSDCVESILKVSYSISLRRESIADSKIL